MQGKLIILVTLVFFVSFVSAIPQTFNVHGRLLDSDRLPLDGTYSMDFNIYDVYTGGSALYTETLSVAVDAEGIYNAILEDIDLDFSEQYYLGISVEGDAEMTPRMNLTSSPYVFRANVSDYLVATSNYEISNLTLTQKITFALGETIDNIVDGWIRIIGGLNVTGGMKVAEGLDVAGGLNVGEGLDVGGDFEVDGSDFYVDSGTGRVGIGTATPNARLQVNGTINVTTDVCIEGADTCLSTVAGSSDTLDGYDSTYFMPLNKSVSGEFDFNGGWENNGLTIKDGDIYAQTGWFYNISSLEISQLEINGSIFPDLDNQFDIGSSSLRWRDLYLSGEVYSNGTGDSYFLGRVGIKTASPGYDLEVAGTLNAESISINGVAVASSSDTYWSNSSADIYYSGGSVGIGTSSPTYKLEIVDVEKALNVSDVLYVNGTSGNVGIGTSSPGVALDVVGQIDATEHISIPDGKAFRSGTGNDLQLYHDGSNSYVYNTLGKVIIRNVANTDIEFRTNDVANRLVIDSGGNVGIGTDSPTSVLDLGDGNLTMGNDDTTGSILFGDFGNYIARDSADGSLDIVSGQDDIVLLPASNVGIGTSSPDYKLEVEATANPSIEVKDTTNSVQTKLQSLDTIGIVGTRSNHDFRIDTNNAVKMTIESGGNVGIGVTDPEYKLEVSDQAKFAGGSLMGVKYFGVSNSGTARWAKLATLRILGAYDHVHVSFILQDRYYTSELNAEVSSSSTYNGGLTQLFNVRNLWGNGFDKSRIRIGRKDTGSEVQYEIWINTGTWSNVYYSVQSFHLQSDTIIDYHSDVLSDTDPTLSGFDASYTASDDVSITGGLTIAGTLDPNGAITLPTTGISGAGSGSGLDADLWDGNQFASYLDQAVLTTSSPNFYNVDIKDGHDYGLRFWGGSTSYMISMGSDQDDDGTVTDYSMHHNMGTTAARGFTFGSSDTAVSASINALTGDIHTDGEIQSDGTGDSWFMGDVGIGTSSPGYALSVAGVIHGQATANSGDVLRIGNDAKLVDIDVGNTAGLYSSSDSTIGSLKLGSGGGTISGYSGNVGIGTSTPWATLDVAGNVRSTAADGFRISYGNESVIHRYDGSNYWLLFSDTETGSWNTKRPFSMAYATGDVKIGNTALYVEHNGDVGIGDATPDAKLDVAGNINAGTEAGNTANILLDIGNAGSPQISISDTNGDNYWAVGADDADNSFKIMGSASSMPTINNLATPFLEITTAGRVGIGTGAPSAKLDVEVPSGGAATIGSSGNVATGDWAVAMGASTTASGSRSIAMGSNTDAEGSYSTAMGHSTNASSQMSTAMGYITKASGDYSTAMGYDTTASGTASTAMGYQTDAEGSYSTAMGSGTNASGIASTAMGISTVASSSYAVATGYHSTASGDFSTAMGFYSATSANGAIALGKYAKAQAANSFAWGGDACTSTSTYCDVDYAGQFGIFGHLCVATASGACADLADGNAQKQAGGTAWTAWSDERLKDYESLNISALSALENLNPIKYTFSDFANKEFGFDNETVMYGFTAQDVQKEFPEMVSIGGDGYLMYNPSGFESILTKAIQELKQEKDLEIKELKIENEMLRIESKTLNVEIDLMKVTLCDMGRDEWC